MTAVRVCLYRCRDDYRGPGLLGSRPFCLQCEVAGCVCELCEDCERNVNPYTHFTWPGFESKPGTCPGRSTES